MVVSPGEGACSGRPVPRLGDGTGQSSRPSVCHDFTLTPVGKGAERSRHFRSARVGSFPSGGPVRPPVFSAARLPLSPSIPTE